MDVLLPYLKCFLVGGLLCAVGQVLIDKTALTPARILTCYVVAGVALGALGLYEPLIDFAGAGATVPLTGFGNTLSRGMRRAVAERGALCAVGQVLIDKTGLTPARILTLYVVAGVILGALGLYQPLIDFAGAGASVPLTGFGSALAKGMRRAVAEQGALGIFTGGFTAAAAGICAAVVFGFLAALLFRSREKG